MLFYPLFPGITLAFVSVNSPNWPESDLNSQIKPLLINYCVLGRSELLLDDGTYVYLKENDFSVSQQTAQKEYLFPTGHYQGIKLYIEAELLPRDIMEAFEIDFIHLKELYLKKRPTYINQTEGELASVFQKLWEFYQAPCAFYMKCCTLELLYKLLTCEIAPSKTCEFYTATQVAIAKKSKTAADCGFKKTLSHPSSVPRSLRQ